jgi:hypothetical protein
MRLLIPFFGSFGPGVRGPPGRLTSRLRQRSIAAQGGRGRNEVEVGGA